MDVSSIPISGHFSMQIFRWALCTERLTTKRNINVLRMRVQEF